MYDIIVLGDQNTAGFLDLKQLFLTNLFEDGVMLCIGPKRCKQMRVQLHKCDVRVEEYGLLPRKEPTNYYSTG